MSDLEEAKRLLGEAQALMYVDDPPGKNEIKAYQNITAALALMEGEALNIEQIKHLHDMVAKAHGAVTDIDTELLKYWKPPAEEPEKSYIDITEEVHMPGCWCKKCRDGHRGKPTEEIKGSPFKGGGWRHG